MAKLKFDGLSEHLLRLEKLSNQTGKVTGKAMYEGAKIVADDLKSALGNLPTDDRRGIRTERKGLRSIEKAGLIASMGVSRAKHYGASKNVSVGFHGYNSLGKPNRMIAGALENGTSFMRPNKAISKSFRKSKPKAESRMIEIINSEIEKLTQ